MELKFIQIAALIHMILDSFHVIFARSHWKYSKNLFERLENRNKTISINLFFEVSNMIETIITILYFFTGYLRIGIIMTLFSILTYVTLKKYIEQNAPFSKTIFEYLILDWVVTILLLMSVINPLDFI